METNQTGIELSLEQQANLQIFKQSCKSLSREQAIDLLGDLYRQTIIKESMYKDMLKQQLGF